MSDTDNSTDGTEGQMWEVERVYTHRSEDRTYHHVRADNKRHAENRLERLEQQGETDDRGNEIESQAGNPIHVHVNRAWSMDTGTDQ
jgi:hypothetical protein